MGKETGFLEFDREDRTYRDPEERLTHYKEFVVPLSEKQLRNQAARCMNCGIPYCHNGCPVNNIIPDWNHLVYEDDWKNALEVLHSTNNFPEFTGRVCPAPCEAACTLNIVDEPVTIKSIECAIIDLVRVGANVRKLLDVIPEADARIHEALVALIEHEVLIRRMAES